MAAVTGTLATRRRRRELAGDARAGVWARGDARRAQRRYVRAHWRLLALAVAATAVPVTVAVLLIPDMFTRGFLLGAALAGTAGALWCWVLQATGTTPAMMGDLAEQWTASELRALRRGGWRTVNHLSLRAWDIDHVLVGPAGVWVVETKWSSRPWQLEPPEERVRAATRQASGNARDLRLWAELRAAGVRDVHPVVMLWGACTGELAARHGILPVDGVPVVPGAAAAGWRAALPREQLLTDAQVEQVWAALDRQARRRDSQDSAPLPPSGAQLIGRALLVVAAGLLGVLAGAKLLELVGALYVWVPGCLLLAVAAVPLRRHPLARLPALAWQTGLAGCLAVAAAVALSTALT